MGARILRPWVEELPLRMQSVLLLALRGCDSVPKEDSSKVLVRYYRWCVLHNSDNPDSQRFGTFMRPQPPGSGHVKTLFDSLDHYPVHWLMHFLHGVEILAYKYPDPVVSGYWLGVYLSGVRALHLSPEPEKTLDVRLGPGENG